MSTLIKAIETDQLLASINSINSVLQLKDKEVQASDYQVALLKIAYTALHELNNSMTGGSSSWALNKMQQSLEEFEEERLKNENNNSPNWVLDSAKKQCEIDPPEISIFDCVHLLPEDQGGER